MIRWKNTSDATSVTQASVVDPRDGIETLVISLDAQLTILIKSNVDVHALENMIARMG